MNELAKKWGAPVLPSVNLVPADIAERRKMRAVIATAWVAILIAVGVVVAGFVLGLTARGIAQADVNNAVAEQDAAIQARDAYAPLYDRYYQREIEEYAIGQTTYGEILYSDLSAAILATATEETSFDIIEIDGPDYQGLRTDLEHAIGGAVGTFIFNARATSQEEATALVQRLEAVPGFVDVSGTSEVYASDDGTVFWQIVGTGHVMESWLTQRLLPQESVTGIDALGTAREDELEEAGVEPSPEPVPSPAPSADTESEG